MSHKLMNTGKRAIATVVSITTVLSTMGTAIFLPLATKAAMAGDLIKMPGLSTVYYLGADGKRWVFPNSSTYNSWYKDFSGVKTVSATELQSYGLGGNVTIRPGTMLVKITTDPKVYAVEPGGVLRHIDSEATAKTLYGAGWASMVVDVADSFFTNYKIDSTAVSAASGYPSGTLVKMTGSSDVYLVDGKNIRKFTGTSLADNGFNSMYVVTAPSSWTATAGTDITGKESKLTDLGGSASSSSSPVVMTGGVTVALSPSTKGAGAIPGGSFYAPLLTLSVKNTTSGDALVKGLVIRREGIASDADIAGILITDKMGKLHGSLVTFGQSIANSGFENEPIKIASGQTVDVNVNVNLKTITNSGTISATIAAASDVTVTDSSGTAIKVEGSFPIKGSTMTTVSGTGAIGKLNVSTRTIIGGTSAAPIELDQGLKDVDVAKFRLQEITGNEDLELTNITIQNNGSASGGDVMNIRLVDQSNAVIASVPTLINNEAKFNISGLTGTMAGPTGGYKILNGQLRDFTVKVDLASNTNSANRTLNFTIQNDYKIRAVGLETGVGVTPAEDTGQTYPIGDGDTGSNFVKFREGTVTISRSTESLSGKVVKGATNVNLAKFNIQAFGEDIELQELGFVVRSSSAGLAVGRFVLNGSLKIQSATGGNIYSQTATDGNIYGANSFTVTNNTISGSTAPDGNGTQHVLNSFYTIKSGTTGTITFVGDINQNATGADNYTIRITSFKVRRVSSNNFVTTGGSTTDLASGNNLAVDDSTLTVSKASDFNPTNLVKGGSLQKIGSYTLRAGAAEGQAINAIKIRVGAVTGSVVDTTAEFDSTAVTDLQNVSNITLKDSAGVSLAPANTIGTASGFTFSVAGLSIPVNGTKVVNVYAVVNTAFSKDNIGTELTVTSSVGSSSQSTTISPAVIGQSIALKSAGNLAVTSLGQDGIINVAKLLAANETDVSAFKFQLRETLNAEPLTLDKLYLGIKNGNNNLADSYKLFDADSGKQLNTSSASLTGSEVRFTGLGYSIPQGGVKNLVVKVSTPSGATIPVGASADRDVTMGVTYLEFTGVSSGSTNRVSGGIVTAYDETPTTTDTITVNDVTNFEVGDSVAFDYNNNGVFTDTVDGASEAAVTVASVGTNTITLTGINRTTKAGFVAGGRITNFTFTSEAHHVEETKPVLASKDVGTGAQVIENAIGTFTVSTVGSQPITPVKMRFEISGSYASGFGPKRFRLDRANPTTGDRISNTLGGSTSLAGAMLVGATSTLADTTIVTSGQVIEFTLPTNEQIAVNGTNGYVLLADTTNIKNNSTTGTTATTLVRMLGAKAVSTATDNALTWSYKRTADNSPSGDLTISDSYIVTGKFLLYQ